MREKSEFASRRHLWLSAVLLAASGPPAVAQDLAHAFNQGSGISAGTEVRLVSAIGQPVVGRAGNAANRLELGFLAAVRRAVSVGVFDESDVYELPADFQLHPNYPNPFNPATTIAYDVPLRAHVVLKVYSVLGREVASLVNKFQPPGRYTVSFDASGLPSGTFFYRIEADGFRSVRTMILLK